MEDCALCLLDHGGGSRSRSGREVERVVEMGGRRVVEEGWVDIV